MRTGSVTDVKKFALIPMLAFVLAACAHDPRVAATVAGTAIPVSDVEIIAKVLCASASAQSQDAVPTAQVNQYAVTYLAGAKAYADLARRQGSSTPTGPSQPVVLPPIPGLSAAEQQRASDLVTEITRASIVPQAQLLGTFAGWLQDEAKAGRFTANPEYPILAGSLSMPVSKAATPDATSVVSLPASQKCGR